MNPEGLGPRGAVLALSFSPLLCWQKEGALKWFFCTIVMVNVDFCVVIFLIFPTRSLGQVHGMTFLSGHSAAQALWRSRWLCCGGFAGVSSPGSCWQRHMARPGLQVLSCQCFLPCMASKGCTLSAGWTSLAEHCWQ